jgi:hypothetical protein
MMADEGLTPVTAKPAATGGSDWWADLWADEDAHEIVLKRKVSGGGEETVDTLTLTSDAYSDFEDLVLYVKENYGGGVFVIYRRGDDGRFQAGTRKQFACAGPVRRYDNEPERAARAEGGVGGIEGLTQLMLQQQAASDARMEKMIAALAARPVDDPVANFQRTAEVLRGLAQPQQPREKSLMEAAMEKKMLEWMESGGASGGAGSEIGGLAALSAMAAPFFSFMGEAAKADQLKAAAQLQAQKTRVPGQALPAPAPAPASGEAAPAAPAAASDQTLALIAAPGFDVVLGHLVGAAKNKVAPGLVADQLLLATPDRELLKQFLLRQDALAQLKAKNPEVEAHWDWFGELAGETLEKLGVDLNGSALGEPESQQAATSGDAGSEHVAAGAPAANSGRQARDGGHTRVNARPGAKGPTKPGSTKPRAVAG